jgi:hypothetical protein
LTLIIEDESGFSFVPNRNHTWAPVGKTPILRETPGRHNHTCIGFITRTPIRHLLQFRFTTFVGAARFEDFVFLLSDIHYYYRSKVFILWDNLPSHHAVDAYFTGEHPDWLEFEYFPVYSLELNPVETCWNKMKNDYLPNFVPTTNKELVDAVEGAARRINEEKRLRECFNSAGIPP